MEGKLPCLRATNVYNLSYKRVMIDHPESFKKAYLFKKSDLAMAITYAMREDAVATSFDFFLDSIGK